METLLCEQWSPEQKRRVIDQPRIIYRHVWRDKKRGGVLHVHLREARKNCRKRYGRYDSRGRLAGKRLISKRPASIEKRTRIGDWESTR